MSIERVVALLTPVFAAVSAWLTGWVATHFPGLPAISPGNITAIQVAGITAAAAAAIKWLHGRSQYTQAAAAVTNVEQKVAEVVANATAGTPALADIEALVASHSDEIVKALEQKVGVPASAQQIVDEILARLKGSTSPSAVAAVVPLNPEPPAAA